MTIYLVRHGLAEAGVEDLDPGLAPLGHEQARAAAEWLRSRNIGRVVVSPLRRTRETAAPIAAAFSLEPEVREEVAEVFAPDMPAGERQAMVGPFMAGRWSEQPEELRQWRARVVQTVTVLGREAAAAGHDLAVVSHYIAIGVVIGEAMGDDRVVPVPMANCSITVVDVRDGRLELVEACAVEHLGEDLRGGSGEAHLRQR